MNTNKILVLPIRRFYIEVNTHYMDFAKTDWLAQQSQGEPFT